MFKKVSLSLKLKFENVTGNNNKAEAKIAGITPAVSYTHLTLPTNREV